MAVTCQTKEVIFRDKTRIVVSEENWETGVRLIRLQKEASNSDKKHDDLEKEYFRIYTYPKLRAAVTEGTPPTEEEARRMPSKELDKWYTAVKDLNPDWFIEIPEETKDTEKKRSSRKRK
jgi:hypothetical protein